ncbi:DNA recombination protein RmuC [Candidatus Woesebacteria bacterium]|nr:DNA recombination protein RmuC [Candidatus Woesebacteria bacterium]MCD8527150.1 DNA recombination protein RmuC [Candidatus Woesebacteria bacterium]MCD8546814.1 DNA recombination protein RmuC [Candidatus Woesebacteria bacterium]
MSSELLILVLINIIGLAAVGFFLASRLKPQAPNEEQERLKLKGLVNEVFGEVSTHVTEQSKQVFRGEQEMIAKELQSKHSEIEKVVSELRRELKDRQRDIQELEQERNKQFSEVATHIREHQKITEKLSEDTQKLRNILSNNQQRGQWGEYILDDILRSAGLVENVHYSKQTTFATSNVKPDVTLLLPNNRSVAIDVKFPYSAVYKMADAETTQQKVAAKKEFVQDVKAKVKQIVDRGYISPEEGTLDYAILFVPNEMLFSFINQQAPEVIDLALQQKVMIVSPFTFLIVARTVIESYRNFMIENNLRDIIRFIGDFVDEWGRFEKEFTKFDDQISRMRKAYDQIASTRYNRMQLRINRIEEYRHGMLEEGESPKALKE